jgi:hypothetical protein
MFTFIDRIPRSVLILLALALTLGAGFGLGVWVQHRRTIGFALADIKAVHGKCVRGAPMSVAMDAACHREEDSRADSTRIMRIVMK